MTSTTVAATTLVRGGYDAFARGDVAAVMDLLDDRIEWSEAEGNPYHPGRPLVGKEEVLALLGRLAEDFEDFRIDVDRFVDGGSTVVVLARYRAAQARPTGRPLDCQAAHVWDVRDGKVVRFQQYCDTRQYAAVLGS